MTSAPDRIRTVRVGQLRRWHRALQEVRIVAARRGLLSRGLGGGSGGDRRMRDAHTRDERVRMRSADVRGGLGHHQGRREFLDADPIDEMHVAIALVDYGSGLRLWDRPEELEDRFHLERITAPGGVEHCFLCRR
ncbi:hypothetical protein MTQ12_05950 [Brevibacterium sp. R8603A2]|uniref:hypothetical protein n=1 Tax=Brevibacterium sp. R8603A2 TaxID=2929779 RepID=UPI001FFB407E|nr:hypothetical protein [Brevibacterium sp. R8603A2]MCK1802597.1 hypothetical protein [Brevibacterium sp. R8603A2]